MSSTLAPPQVTSGRGRVLVITVMAGAGGQDSSVRELREEPGVLSGPQAPAWV